jgi:molecular chaperone DnaJ
MSATEQDYYELLGLARGASEQDVKKAFRRLAREHHPDVSSDPEAEVRFREITEAYEVLSNAESRQLYDRYGHAGLRSSGFQPGSADFGNLSDVFSAFFGEDVFGGRGRASAATHGGDLGAEVTIELEQAARGAQVAVEVKLAATCATCDGNGAAPGSAITACAHCGGSGRVQQVSRSLFGEFIRQGICADCDGTGQLIEQRCSDCGGSGRTLQQRSIEVDVPAGIHDGQQIRLSGEGHAGSRGGRSGDLYVAVHVLPDARFVREGNDLFSHVHLTMVEAALGATVSVETLDGPHELEFAPGTQPGEVRVLRGKGMPVVQRSGRGDQRVLVNVSVPRHLSEAQRALLAEFERGSDEHTYRHDPSFFDRLKGAFH